MRAVLITFSSAATPAEVAGPFEQYAQLLLDVPGLIGKTWLTADSVLGGFHLFESAAAADDYLTGPLFGRFSPTRRSRTSASCRSTCWSRSARSRTGSG